MLFNNLLPLTYPYHVHIQLNKKSSFTYGTYGLGTGIIQLLTPLAHNFDNKFIKNEERGRKITIFHNLNTTVGVRFMVSKFWKRADEFYSFFYVLVW